MTFDEIQKEYRDILKVLSDISGKTIDELNKEVSNAVSKCKTTDDLLSKLTEDLD